MLGRKWSTWLSEAPISRYAHRSLEWCLLSVGAARHWYALHIDLVLKSTKVGVERVYLLLQRLKVLAHVLELLAVFEAIAAIGCINTLQGEVTTALTWRLTIALDLASLAFVACYRDV